MTCNPYTFRHRDVIDGDRWQAACARCRWEGPPRTNAAMAALDRDMHTDDRSRP